MGAITVRLAGGLALHRRADEHQLSAARHCSGAASRAAPGCELVWVLAAASKLDRRGAGAAKLLHCGSGELGLFLARGGEAEEGESGASLRERALRFAGPSPF